MLVDPIPAEFMFKGLRDNRRYIRHEMNVPIEIVSISAASSAKESVDVSYGGLAFVVDQLLYVGEVIQLRMPTVTP
ncbi:MAG TPA: PilZ domain-containing protein, partial [Longimicrobiales bacterium]|nr:PilZ domain-containing protein [Longimicrobiales bacterium]